MSSNAAGNLQWQRIDDIADRVVTIDWDNDEPPEDHAVAEGWCCHALDGHLFMMICHFKGGGWVSLARAAHSGGPYADMGVQIKRCRSLADCKKSAQQFVSRRYH